MVKDIEKEFFKAFEPEPFGILDKCFWWMADEYDLGVKHDKNSKAKPKTGWNKEKLDFHNWQEQEIKDQAEKFDDRVISFGGYHITDAPLMVEISNNLDECKDDKATERYIYDLLTPFSQYSDIMHPKAVIERYQAIIEENKKDLQIWEQEPDSTMKQAQIGACKHEIERWQFQIERAKYVANKYCEILHEMWDKTGTVEYYLDYFIHLIGRYAHALDVLLLKRGINLLYYQQECGIYLFEHRNITVIESYLGGLKLAQKYIDEALPKLTGEPKRQDNEIVLPDEKTPKQQFYDCLDAMQEELVKKYFPRAISNRYMKETDMGYKWQSGRTQCAQRAYFLTKVLMPKDYNCKFPYKIVGKAFGIKGKDIYNLYKNISLAKPPKWLTVMNEKLFYDYTYGL